MIFAAGLGTRLRPLTDTTPKALIEVGGVSLLDRTISRLRSFGYDHFVVNVHHHAQQIIDHIAKNELYSRMVQISDEREKLLETGGGLKRAASLFRDDEPVLIHNVDILDNVDYDWFGRQHLDTEDAVLLVSRRQTSRYLLFDHAMRLMGWVNTTTGELRSPYDWVKNPDSAELDMENYRLNIVRGTTDIVFKTFDGKKEYSCKQALSQKGAIVAATVEEFLAAPVGDTQYRLTGVITKVARAEYGNVYIADYSGEAYVYGIGAKGDFEKLGLKEGDIVTLVGKRGEYKGDAQMTGVQYESHISVT